MSPTSMVHWPTDPLPNIFFNNGSGRKGQEKSERNEVAARLQCSRISCHVFVVL